MLCWIVLDDVPLGGPIFHARLCNRCQGLVSCLCGLDSGADECWIRTGGSLGGMDTYPQDRQLLLVGIVYPFSIFTSLIDILISSCVVLFVLFASATLGLSLLSTPASPVAVYVFATFLNGLFAGASMNYTLSHLLHLTSPDANYIVTSLVAMSRGLAGGFGSAIGGGYFLRELQRFLEAGFAERELFGRDDLVRKLLGGPALVTDLQGAEKEVAVQSYQYAVRKLFMAGSILALAATALQAGTGWKAASAKRVDRDVRG